MRDRPAESNQSISQFTDDYQKPTTKCKHKSATGVEIIYNIIFQIKGRADEGCMTFLQ